MECISYICDFNKADAMPADRQKGNPADIGTVSVM